MIAMWDDILGATFHCNPVDMFNNQHQALNFVWEECARIVEPGGFVCINIGDAVRTINKCFALYANHAKIIEFFTTNGFIQLPGLIWRKPTNSPTKFMGSGMQPPGAYVTLEHEHILVFRKAGKRRIEPLRRRESAYFWEERNKWFSDLWEIRGEKQTEDGRRTAAFPLEIPYRLINMFSVQDDFVLDPFMGTGTTMLAALASKRNSIGYDSDDDAFLSATRKMGDIALHAFVNNITCDRIRNHEAFIRERELNGKEIKGGKHPEYGFKCTSKQESQMKFWWFDGIKVPAMLDHMAGYHALYHPLKYETPPDNTFVANS
jgi:DNA modification methylase